MGSLRCSISCVVDIHDTQNMPFATLQNFFSLANIVTRDKIKPIKVEFWQDEKQQDAICTYSFQGWISGFHTSGGGGSNPSLGALQLFQNQVITQSRLLSYVDNYFGLAVLAAVGLIIIAVSNLKNRLARHHFLPW